MPDYMSPQEEVNRLRLEAKDRIKNGTAPRAYACSVSADALSVLFRLASTPDTAAEGLKLLHELQTFQIELDMQHEQLQSNEREFSHDLACFKAFYDMAACGFFMLSADGRITDCNEMGGSLFYRLKDDLCGEKFESLLTVSSRPAVFKLLNRQLIDGPDDAVIVTTELGGKGTRSLRLVSNHCTDSNDLLVMITDSKSPTLLQ
ncbi:MAG: PAS domain-containing protein [Pseudohongiella sp.]|nr:PAS domain-containing protein [Pseudohongiella sp.]